MFTLPRFLRAGLLALLLGGAVAGCGFHLRGSSNALLPYASVYVALPENSDMGIWLRRHIRATGSTELVDRPEQASAVLQQLFDERQKTILSLNAQGFVREYRLQARYGFRVLDNKGRELVPVNEITLIRDITFNDSAVLAKEQEEAMLWRDINNDLVSQILRRLSIVKPKNPDLVED